MDILCFTVRGKLAHYRKYFANNTAFSFTIPPRTALMGLVAAAMGWPKDSYYEALASNHIRFGIRVGSPLKKSFQRLNFLSVKRTGDLAKSLNSDFRGHGGRIQTPFELVSGLSLAKDEVVYQVFMAPSPTGQTTFEEIQVQLLQRTPVYNLSLGIANFQASLTDIELLNDSQIRQTESDDFVLMHSAIPSALVKDLQFTNEDVNHYNFVEEDLMPGDFVGNGRREVKRMNRLLFSTTDSPLRVKTSAPFWQVVTQKGSLNIQFMDA